MDAWEDFMDRTLLTLLILSLLLVAMQAPHATLTLIAVLVLSTLATRGSWAILQSFSSQGATQHVTERVTD